jgi:hypothetical protein
MMSDNRIPKMKRCLPNRRKFGDAARRWILILLFLPSLPAAFSQDIPLTEAQLRSDSIRMAALPPLVLNNRLKTTLPYTVDNSLSSYFPPLFTQYGYSCNQSSSIAYLFTYESNVVRNTSAFDDKNRMSLLFPWNMLNSGNVYTGVSYFDSWELVDAAGCASVADFGHGTGGATDDCTLWMSGYQKYYRAMQNRIEGIWSIDIGTAEGLQTLKNWLFNHGGERYPGGVASFQIASGGYQTVVLPPGTEAAGKIMITRFSSYVGHSLTCVGYNDSVRFDYNNDGRYTNNIDITGDGKVTMLDWEKGALIFVDSYTENWGHTGKGYVSYRLLPNNHTNGGIWMRSVVVARVHPTYKPRLGLRVRLSDANRSTLRITAGVSQDPNAPRPDHVLDLPIFKFQGGAFPMLGTGTGDRKKIEIGIDASPLLDFIEPGREASFFLVINDKETDPTKYGTVEQFSFFDYTHGSDELYYDKYNMAILHGYQDFKINFAPEHHPPEIATPSLPDAAAGQPYQVQLEASGGTMPYKWLPIRREYREEIFADTFPAITQNRILPVVGNDDKATVNLPFSFPLYDRRFSRMTVYTNGTLMFEASNYTYPYAVDPQKLLAMNRAIYPWYNADLSLPQNQDWIYYKADSSCATIRWNASVIAGYNLCDVNFAARIYPSGIIEFYYGNIEMRPTFKWFTAVAGGSADHFIYPDINISGVHNGLNIRLTPEDYPEGLTLSPEGLLSGTCPVPGRSWTFPVWVEDHDRLRASREFTLTTGAVSVPVAVTAKSSVNVWPVPVAGEINIQIGHSRGGAVMLEILDLNGRSLFKRTFETGGGESTLRCGGFSGLPGGIYVYRLTGAVNASGKLLHEE